MASYNAQFRIRIENPDGSNGGCFHERDPRTGGPLCNAHHSPLAVERVHPAGPVDCGHCARSARTS